MKQFHLKFSCQLLLSRFVASTVAHRRSTRYLPHYLIANVFLIFCTHVSFGQYLSRQTVNQLLTQLAKTNADSSRVEVMVKLGEFHLHKPGEDKLDLDSSLTYLLQAKKLCNSQHLLKQKHKVETLILINYLEGGRNQLAHSLFSQLIKDCRQTNDIKSEADARFAVGDCLAYISNNYDVIIDNYSQATAIYRRLHDQDNEIRVLSELAAIHIKKGQLGVAQNELLRVVSHCESNKCDYLHYTYNWLAYISRLKGDFNISLQYSLRGIEKMRLLHDTLSAPIFYSNIGQMYSELGKKDQSVEWHKKSLLGWRQQQAPNIGMYISANIIAHDLIDHKNPQKAFDLINNLAIEIPPKFPNEKAYVSQSYAYCYKALKKHELAEKYYSESLLWYKKISNESILLYKAKLEVGQFYLLRKDFEKAEFYLRPLLTDSSNKATLSSMKDVHFLLFRVDSAKGNYLSAIRHFKMHKLLNDSLYNKTMSRQFAQLEFQYETTKNKQNIALLQEQSNLQESQLQQGRTFRNAILGGLILVILLLGLSYNRYRLKQRSNQLLEAKQAVIDQKNQALQQVIIDKDQLLTEREWMLKEIHHRVKNNLQVVTSLLSSQSDFLHDSTALAAIRESQNRVHAMALIHQKLYQSDNLALVDMQQYIHDIVDYLIDSFSRQASVQETLTVSAIQLDVTLATPLGLIINEAVTNSLKYAFPENRPGRITISFLPLENQTYSLTISDDGIGWPAGFDVEQNDTLGLSMIRGLSRQIGGHLNISQCEGVHISLTFSQTKKVARSGREVV